MVLDDLFETISETGDEERRTIDVAVSMANIVDALVKARLSKGITQRELARMIGMEQSVIGRFEKLQVVPRLDTVIKIANALDVSIIPMENDSTDSQSNIIFFNRFRDNDKQYVWNSMNNTNAGVCYETVC